MSVLNAGTDCRIWRLQDCIFYKCLHPCNLGFSLFWNVRWICCFTLFQTIKPVEDSAFLQKLITTFQYSTVLGWIERHFCPLVKGIMSRAIYITGATEKWSGMILHTEPHKNTALGLWSYTKIFLIPINEQYLSKLTKKFCSSPSAGNQYVHCNTDDQWSSLQKIHSFVDIHNTAHL